MEDLAHHFKNAEIVQATAEQIIKDFSLFDIEITFTGNTGNAYRELSRQITPYIKKLMDSNYSAFLNLLYRVDISESKIKAAASEENSLPEAVTHLIIRREMEKAVTRKLFGQGGKPAGSL